MSTSELCEKGIKTISCTVQHDTEL